MKLVYADIVFLLDIARRDLIETPGEYRTEDMTRQMTLGERRAIAFLQASIRLMRKKGMIADGVDTDITLQVPDSEPSAEYWLAGLDDNE